MEQEISVLKERFAQVVKQPDRDNLMNLIKEEMELDGLELKEKWIDWSELAKIMLAIGNYGGGLIVFGIKEIKEQRTFEPIGLDETFDSSDLYNKVKKFLPDAFKFQSIPFEYNSNHYDVSGKYQLIIINNQDHLVPMISANEGKGIQKGQIYIKKGTSTNVATNGDIEGMIRRRLDTLPPRSSISFKEHIQQLKDLYGFISPTKFTAFQFPIILGQESPNPDYPEETFEQFISKMIEYKKMKIASILEVQNF